MNTTPAPAGDAAQDPPQGRSAHRFFFMHIMKTAGTSFAQHLARNFAEGRVYPDLGPGPERREQYISIPRLQELGREGLAHYDCVHGHFPYLAADLIGADHTLVILREPVDRAVSMLRHLQRHHPRQAGKSLEEVYDDVDWDRRLYVANYQVRQFCMTLDDRPDNHTRHVVVDDVRFRAAVDHLDEVSVLGLTDRYDEFVDEVARRFGWRFGRGRRLQAAGGEATVPAALLRRIREDNAADVAFYEEAVARYERRARAEA